MIKSYLYVERTGTKGRGVFTKEKIPAGTLIESSPVIVMTKEDRVYLDKTLLHDYIFEWGPDKDQCCMALGLISIYNHDHHSNCEYFMEYEDEIIIIKSTREIENGAELTINYNGGVNEPDRIWFDINH